MSLGKRIWISLRRQPGKSIIYFLIAFLLGCVYVSASNFVHITSQITKDLQSQISTRLSVASSLNLPENMPRGENYDETYHVLDQAIKELIKDQSVDYASFNYFLLLDTDTLSTQQEYWNRLFPYSEKENDDYFNAVLFGVHEALPMEFQEGTIKLTQGRSFTQNEIDQGAPVVLVSETYYQDENGEPKKIEVGDSISLKKVIYNRNRLLNDILYEESLELEVIGKFKAEANMKDSGGDERSIRAIDYPDFRLYVPNNLVKNTFNELNQLNLMIKGVSAVNDSEVTELMGIYTSVFKLKEGADLDIFKNKVNAAVRSLDDYSISTSADSLEKILNPIRNQQQLAQTIAVFSIVAVTLILTLITLIFIKDRRTEIGIIKVLGEKNSRIFIQFFAELWIIVMTGVTVSFFLGNRITGTVYNTLFDQVSQQIAESESEFASTDSLLTTSKQIAVQLPQIRPVKNAGLSGLRFEEYILFVCLMSGTIIISEIFPFLYIRMIKPISLLKNDI